MKDNQSTIYEFLSGLDWLKKGMCKDESRKNMMGIEFSKKRDKITLMASNGFLILRETFTDENYAPDFSVTVSDKSIKSIKASIVGFVGTPKKQENTHFSFEFDPITELLSLVIQETGVKFPLLVADTDYPALAQSIQMCTQDNSTLPEGKITLDAPFLSIILSGFNAPMIKFSGNTGMIRIDEASTNREGFLMPIRTNEDK